VGEFIATDGGATALFLSGEAAVLADLTRVLIALLDDTSATREPGSGEPDPLIAMVGIDPQAQRPENPALARLLPDGYRDDDDAAGEFRRFTQADLIAGKLLAARAIRDDLAFGRDDPEAPEDGSVVRLDADRARVWLRGLNDVRLALGTSLGVTDDDDPFDDDGESQDPGVAMRHIYAWLTAVQDSLVGTLIPRPA
jgi:hypothetical protein